MYSIDTSKPITQQQVLERVNQFKVWWWILGNNIQAREGELIRNTLRNDTTPGAWLSWGIFKQHKVVLNDFASAKYHGFDIFQAVSHKYKCDTQKAIEIINNKFKLGLPNNPINKISQHQVKLQLTKAVGQFRSHISFVKRRWNKADAEYWTQYGIHLNQLKEDNVFPVKVYRKNNKYDKTIKVYKPDSLCYALTFESNGTSSIKLYQPYESKQKKWISNTKKTHIWGMDSFPSNNACIITKSYKDYRVLKNVLGNEYDIYAVQNEKIIIPDEHLSYFSMYYSQKCVLLYDNDSSGIEGAANNILYCNKKYPNLLSSIKIDGRKKVKDAAEYYVKYGAEDLQIHIKQLLTSK